MIACDACVNSYKGTLSQGIGAHHRCSQPQADLSSGHRDNTTVNACIMPSVLGTADIHTLLQEQVTQLKCSLVKQTQ